MEREKKITIKPFLNTTQGHDVDPVTKEWLYPLYFRVGYNRRSTKFRVGEHSFPISFEEELGTDQIVKGAVGLVEKIIRYEISLYDDFEITEIGKKIRTYLSYLSDIVSEGVQYSLHFGLAQVLTSDEFYKWSAITPVIEKIQKGVEILENGVHKETLLEIEMLDLIERIGADKVTIYEWLVDGKSLDYLTKSRALLKGQSRYFDAELLDRSSLFDFNVIKVDALIRNYLHDQINEGFNIVYDLESGNYKSKKRIFERLA